MKQTHDPDGSMKMNTHAGALGGHLSVRLFVCLLTYHGSRHAVRHVVYEYRNENEVEEFGTFFFW